MDIPVPVVALELPSYQRKENFGSDETFYQLVKALAGPVDKTPDVTANLIGPLALGFRHRDDIEEVKGLLYEMGIGINVVAPFDATPHDLTRLGAAHINILMYPEHAETAARHMERTLGIPYTKTIPIGVGATHDFVAEVARICGVEPKKGPVAPPPALVVEVGDSTYLTGKRVFLFGDADPCENRARIARDEMGFEWWALAATTVSSPATSALWARNSASSR